ncbi:helix-turn-helix domain-containing protein [Bdellovibrionota bacterium FG-1]
MSKPRIELKDALKAMNVAEPMRIPRNLGFSPPICAQPKLPQNEAPQNKEPQKEGAFNQGYFALSHGALQNPQVMALSGDGFRVFLWMNTQAWRFPNSNGEVRASVSYLSRNTGVSSASVSRILSSLVEAGMIRRVRVDFERGNIWWVQNLLGRGEPPQNKEPQNEDAQNKVPQFEVPQNDVGAPSKRGSTSLNLRQQVPQNEGEKRNIIKQENKNSLSQEISENLKTYFESLKPVRKRESEWASFLELRQDYHDPEIELAFDFLSTSGLPHSGEPCHSPMGYLAKAMPEVLKSVKFQAEQKQQKEQLEQTRAEIRQQGELQKLQEDLQALEREQAFEAAFRGEAERESWIEAVAARYPALRGCGNAIRGLAVSAWWEERRA